MIAKEQIFNIAEECLEGSDRFVVDVNVDKNNVIDVFIDADTQVTIENCVELSRFVEEHLNRDVEDYELNVSSAGIDFPLKKLRQYNKYVGKDLLVTLNDGKKKIYRLNSFDEKQLESMEVVTKKYGKLSKISLGDALTIKFDEIKEVKPYINF